VQVFHVRGGRIRGQRGFVVDKVEELSTGSVVEQFLEQFYGGVSTGRDSRSDETAQEVPREVLVPALPDDAGAVSEWLAARRGARVDLRVPQRGDKRALLDTVTRNAAQAFALHKTRRASDLTARSRALSELQESLELPDAPLRIECYDVSNLQGTSVVASMVVFEDGLARKSEYRRFSVRGSGPDGATDDVASLYEVLHRRFSRYLEERSRTGDLIDEDGSPRKFAYPPNLVVVDGGAPQVAAAAKALEDLGIDDISLCGLAKRLEEVWLPGEPEPVILPRTSEGLYLLQRVRDEAHRFAITYHRQKRSKSMVESLLDDVPGLGETRRKALLRHFGSLKRLRAATAAEIAEVPGVGPRTAEAVVAALHEPAGDSAAAAVTPAVDPATGEILDQEADLMSGAGR
jgi:excinuclease ABC subunit C